MEDLVASFVAITGATPEAASGMLELTNQEFESAIALYYEDPSLASAFPAATSNAPAPSTQVPRPSARAGRQDAEGIVHLDSDDDTDLDMQFIDDDDEDLGGRGNQANRDSVMNAANRAQEEEDAAMAKRMQEELYGGGAPGAAMGGEEVRAPIARTTETLVAPDPTWAGQADVDASAFLDQMRRRAPAAGRPRGPFSQSIWGDSARQPAAPSEAPENGGHLRRLEDLFRPPHDLIASYNWDEARGVGKEEKKWILVNLQDMSDFNCQALNRDIWKDEAVKDLVAENFIFLQYDKDYPEAEEYLTFYFPNQSHENPDNYPHVSIVDPRTGEQVKVWSGRPFPSAAEFHSDLAEFLDRYSLAANRKNPVARQTARKPEPVNVERMTEDEMLEMALKNSLAQGQSDEASASNSNLPDPDGFTKSPELDDVGKGKAPEVVTPFARISASNPHTEPDNDPASTTRIQFRHPNGRVIRRFNLQDPVERVYEWLKSEPLEGKDGVDFELKKMPQGQDLIESLEATIEATGLKQGTVMIELLED